ncbi:MAG: hypothetical protein ACTSR3_21400 [Candidatus Helarchaeota archaeon]
MSYKELDFEKFIKNIECTISSDSKLISPGRLPIIKVLIKYKGNDPVKISWDDDFGRLLWEGKFVLFSNSDTGSYNTSNLKFKTSNVYPPRKIIELNKDDELISILNFSELPISYESEQFMKKNKFSLVLCSSKAEEKKVLKPISNELVFNAA